MAAYLNEIGNPSNPCYVLILDNIGMRVYNASLNGPRKKYAMFEASCFTQSDV